MGVTDEHSPIDPDGKWYASHLVDDAEDMYRARYGYRRREAWSGALTDDQRGTVAAVVSRLRDVARVVRHRMDDMSQLRSPAPRSEPIELPPADDLRVQSWLRQMGEAT